MLNENLNRFKRDSTRFQHLFMFSTMLDGLFKRTEHLVQQSVEYTLKQMLKSDLNMPWKSQRCCYTWQHFASFWNSPTCDVPRKVAATLRKNCRCRLLHSSDAVFKCFLLLKTTVQLFRVVFKIPFQMTEVTDIICTEMFQESIRLLHVMNYR